MKVIIAGSRTITNPELIELATRQFLTAHKITEVVSGCAAGVDMLGIKWAERNQIPVQHFPANWLTHGKAAGPIRNREMAKYADALIAIWDGVSSGTNHMINSMHALGKLAMVFRHQPG